VETLAVVSGLNYRLLRHRARKPSPEMLSQWEQVWTEVRQRSRVLQFALEPISDSAKAMLEA